MRTRCLPHAQIVLPSRRCNASSTRYPKRQGNGTRGSWGKASASTLAHARYKPQPFQADHQPPGFAGEDSLPEKPVRAVASELTALLSLPFHVGLMALYRPSPVPAVPLTNRTIAGTVSLTSSGKSSRVTFIAFMEFEIRQFARPSRSTPSPWHIGCSEYRHTPFDHPAERHRPHEIRALTPDRSRRRMGCHA